MPGFACNFDGMTTLLAILTLALSAFLVLGNLRTVVMDTFETVALSAQRARENGVLVQRLAFLGLWLMIFALSYL